MFQKHNPEIGARPGTLAIPPDSPFPKVTVLQYDEHSVDRFEIEDVSELRVLEDKRRVTWVDVQGLGDEGTIRAIGDAFELHPLALEDAVNVPQRAKTELYEHHQLLIARTPQLDDSGDVRAPQVCFIVGKRYLLTFQERYYGFFDPVRKRIVAGLGAIRSRGSGYLAYALMDAMIDRYYPVAQRLSDGLEELEDLVLENPRPRRGVPNLRRGPSAGIAIAIVTVLLNYTRNPLRRLDFEVGIGVNEDLTAAQQLGVEVLSSMEAMIDEPPPLSAIERSGDWSVPIGFFAWVDQRETDFMKAKSEATRLVKVAFDDANIEMPEPIYRVHMSKEAESPARSRGPGPP